MGKYNFLRSTAGFTRKLGKLAIKKLEGGGLYTGMGKYKGRGSYVQMNGLMQDGRASMKSWSANDETQSITICHQEYIGDIFGTSTTQFSNQTFPVNPGMSSVFPFLSQIAVNYEEYELKQCVFCFKSTIDSSTAANGQTGTLIMATNYNPDTPPFSNKEQMLSYHGSHSGRLTEDFRHGVECDPRKNSGSAIKRIRVKTLRPEEDEGDYDMGKFNLAQNNCPSTFANQAVGELWVYYTVTLHKPKIGAGRGDCIQRDIFGYKSSTASNFALPFGPTDGSLLLRGENSLNCRVVPVANGVKVTFPATYSGVVQMILSFEGTSLTYVADNLATTGNVGLWKDLFAVPSAADPGNTPAGKVSFASGTNYFYVIKLLVKSSTGGVENTCMIQPNMTAGNVTQAYLEIVEVNQSFAIDNNNPSPRFYDNVTGAISSIV